MSSMNRREFLQMLAAASVAGAALDASPLLAAGNADAFYDVPKFGKVRAGLGRQPEMAAVRHKSGEAHDAFERCRARRGLARALPPVRENLRARGGW